MKILLFIILIFSGFFSLEPNPWVAPESASKVENPMKDENESVSKGEKIFKNLCWSCHGNDGNGKGPASVALNPKPADFTSGAVQTQTDGAIFWKITEGRGSMSSYKNSLTTTQRWHLVNYIRKFKK